MATLTAAFAAARGTEPALVDDTGSTTWAELDERVNRLVNGLRDMDLANGDRVAVVAGNRREWFEIALACSHGGWGYVPVNWHLVADELAYMFDDAAAVAVFIDPRYTTEVHRALDDPRGASVKVVVALGEGARHDRSVDYDAVIARILNLA